MWFIIMVILRINPSSCRYVYFYLKVLTSAYKVFSSVEVTKRVKTEVPLIGSKRQIYSLNC